MFLFASIRLFVRYCRVSTHLITNKDRKMIEKPLADLIPVHLPTDFLVLSFEFLFKTPTNLTCLKIS